MAFSYNVAERFGESLVNGVAYTRNTQGLVKLYQADDPPALDGTGGTEIGNGHGGKLVTFNSTNFGVTGDTYTNLVAITGDANGSGAVTATHCAIWDAAGTTLLLVAPLVAPIEIAAGGPWTIAIGDLDGSFTGGIDEDFANEFLLHFWHGTAMVWPAVSVYFDLVDTLAPTKSVTGTQINGTAYAPAVVACTTEYWVVANNTTQLVTNVDHVAAGNDWDDPLGVNLRDTTTDKRLLFYAFPGGAIPIDQGNVVGYLGNDADFGVIFTFGEEPVE
jgi:hypothetical protein